MYDALQPLISRLGEKPTRSQILTRLGTLELALQKEHPAMLYSDILTHAYERLAQDLEGRYVFLRICDRVLNHGSVEVTTEECVAFGQSIKDWPVFPDSSDALNELSKYYKLVVLSNVDRTSFAFTREKLEAGKFTFNMICTAQDVGSYKPDPANFVYALKAIKDSYGIEKDHVLSTAQVRRSLSRATVNNLCPIAEPNARPRPRTISGYVIFLRKPCRCLYWIRRLCCPHFRIQDTGRDGQSG